MIARKTGIHVTFSTHMKSVYHQSSEKISSSKYTIETHSIQHQRDGHSLRVGKNYLLPFAVLETGPLFGKYCFLFYVSFLYPNIKLLKIIYIFRFFISLVKICEPSWQFTFDKNVVKPAVTPFYQIHERHMKLFTNNLLQHFTEIYYH